MSLNINENLIPVHSKYEGFFPALPHTVFAHITKHILTDNVIQSKTFKCLPMQIITEHKTAPFKKGFVKCRNFIFINTENSLSVRTVFTDNITVRYQHNRRIFLFQKADNFRHIAYKLSTVPHTDKMMNTQNMVRS